MAVRRVRRIIRKIDPWTVLKVSLVFYAVVALGLVLGAVIFWGVLNSAGIPQKLISFLQSIRLLEADAEVVLDGDRLFRLTVFLGVTWTVLMTGLTTLAAVMYNLVSDVVGGIEIVVLEEVLAPPAPVRPQRPWTTPAPGATPPVSDPRPSGGTKDGAGDGTGDGRKTGSASSAIADLPTEETSPVTRR